MKASELIERLQKLVEEYGDLEVERTEYGYDADRYLESIDEVELDDGAYVIR